MNNPADEIVDALIQRARPGFAAIAAELEQKLRARLSVPVGYSGGRIIRSKAGESPRREKDNYRSSHDHITTVDGDVIRAAAGTNMIRGHWLEGGTGTMAARPHYGPTATEYKGVVVDRVAGTLTNS